MPSRPVAPRSLRLSLPCGARAELDLVAARDVPAGRSRSSLDRALHVLRAPGVLSLHHDAAATSVDALPLADFHVLRVALVQGGAIDEPDVVSPCDNCGAELTVAPAREVELGPFRDGELDDPELDAPFLFGDEHVVPAFRVGRGVARSVRLAPRTVGDAATLLRRDLRAPIELTPALVAALGVVAVGRERRASAIARALAAAPDATWDAVCDLWDDAHGHPRLIAAARCVACGARNDVPAPAERELSSPAGPGAAPRRGREARVFPEPDRFAALVRAQADAIFARRRVRGVDLIVDEGVPAVDDGGEPLLGCYTPPHTDDLDIPRPPEIRLFLRTFRAEVEADAAFDLEGEVRETIDHELEHHLNFLAGDDPLDDEERDAIVDERRRVVGRRESTRRGLRALGADLYGFLRVGWPLLLAGAIATWLGTCR